METFAIRSNFRLILNYRSMNRRHFIKTISAVTAAASFPQLLRADKGYAAEWPLATTTYGKIRGYAHGSVSVFKGVPYGSSTAAFRFQAPRAPVPWSDTKITTEFGQMAPQKIELSTVDSFYPKPKKDNVIGEDCLTLNLWTPGLRDDGKRPVMVWLHGGGYSGWSSNVNLYDGVNLCNRGDVVVVTLNHRLNGFGYLYLDGIQGAHLPSTANAGMLDIVLALQWVKDNIAEFGGDPDKVTLFGQSGGGAKCATLMAMPAAKGLFHRVITMSGQQITARTQEHATETTLRVLKKLNLSAAQLGELYKVPMQSLIGAMHNETWGPVIDPATLPHDPFSPHACELGNSIPMIMGNTHDETTYLIGSKDPSTFELSWDQVPEKLSQHVGTFIGKLDPKQIVASYRSWYPKYSPSDVFFSASTAARSWRGFVIQSERRANDAKAATYLYQLDWKSPVDKEKWRAAHTLDVPLAFDNINYGQSMTGLSPYAQHMADMVSEAFLSFARTGKPASPTLPHWPKFDLAKRQTMIFDTVARIDSDPRNRERKLFEQVSYTQPGT
jgi:para-nitrobenzyl esterase